jgi:hypothetical protein
VRLSCSLCFNSAMTCRAVEFLTHYTKRLGPIHGMSPFQFTSLDPFLLIFRSTLMHPFSFCPTCIYFDPRSIHLNLLRAIPTQAHLHRSAASASCVVSEAGSIRRACDLARSDNGQRALAQRRAELMGGACISVRVESRVRVAATLLP